MIPAKYLVSTSLAAPVAIFVLVAGFQSPEGLRVTGGQPVSHAREGNPPAEWPRAVHATSDPARSWDIQRWAQRLLPGVVPAAHAGPGGEEPSTWINPTPLAHVGGDPAAPADQGIKQAVATPEWINPPEQEKTIPALQVAAPSVPLDAAKQASSEIFVEPPALDLEPAETASLDAGPPAIEEKPSSPEAAPMMGAIPRAASPRPTARKTPPVETRREGVRLASRSLPSILMPDERGSAGAPRQLPQAKAGANSPELAPDAPNRSASGRRSVTAGKTEAEDRSRAPERRSRLVLLGTQPSKASGGFERERKAAALLLAPLRPSERILRSEAPALPLALRPDAGWDDPS